jgi:type III pantothenate kinase
MFFFCVDIGNTRTKWALYDEDKLMLAEADTFLNTETVLKIFHLYPEATCILSSTVLPEDTLLQAFRKFKSFMILGPDTRLPFNNRYATPSTLGLDRMALAAAAACSYPGEDVLVIDTGTCITLDFVDKQANYLGGSIHPGLNMRMKAMHNFTGKLPLVEVSVPEKLMGDSTASCMQVGGVMGAVLELNAMITLYQSRYPGCKVVLTGGDAPLFFSLLKNEIFAFPNFVLTGLLKIAQHNV